MTRGLAILGGLVLLQLGVGAAPVEPQPLRVCTDRGALVATVDAEGGIRGELLGDLVVEGTADALRLSTRESGRLLWSGPLDDLHPRLADVTREDLAHAYAERVDGWRARRDRVRGRGFRGRVAGDGRLVGRLKRTPVVYLLTEDGLIGGAVDPTTPVGVLPGLFGNPDVADPVIGVHAASRVAALRRVSRIHMGLTGPLASCPLSGEQAFWVGAFPRPQSLPPEHRVVGLTERQVLVRGPDGASWYMELSLRREDAARLAGQLESLWPEAHVVVAWEEGVALVQVGTGVTPDLTPAPLSPDPSWTPIGPYLPVSEAIFASIPELIRLDGEELDWLDRSGLEMLARLNTLRQEAGLPPVRWNDELASSAALHCAYLDADHQAGGAGRGHDQDPGAPLFVGVAPRSRAGAAEVVFRFGDALPPAAVDGWVETPFHRRAPMHPAAVELGACATPRGIRVMEVRVERDGDEPRVFSYPADGATDVPRTFTGLETPDPLPLERYPAKTLPVGFTLTTWFERLDEDQAVLDTSVVCESIERPHYLVEDQRTDPRGRPHRVLHLIPREPLPAGAACDWSIRFRSGEETLVGGGRFETISEPPPGEMDAAPAVTRMLELLQEERGDLGLPPLRRSRRADAMATRRLAREDAIERSPIRQGWIGYWCLPWEYLRHDRAWDGQALGTLRTMGDSRYDLVGVATDEEQVCLAVSGDPHTPRAPQP